MFAYCARATHSYNSFRCGISHCLPDTHFLYVAMRHLFLIHETAKRREKKTRSLTRNVSLVLFFHRIRKTIIWQFFGQFCLLPFAFLILSVLFCFGLIFCFCVFSF